MLLLSLFIATGSRRFFPFLICRFRRVDHHQTRIRWLSIAQETVSSRFLGNQGSSVSRNRLRLGWVTVFGGAAHRCVFLCRTVVTAEGKLF